MAAIFIQNIPASVTELALTQAIASVLHSSLFRHEGDSPVNFNLHLQRHRIDPTKFTGNGQLIIGDVAIAQLFLYIYGTSPRPGLSCEGERMQILFNRVYRQPPREVFATLQATPWADPQALRERDELFCRLRGQVSISDLQFGWRCRDDAFSIEWDAREYGLMMNSANATFVEETREIRLSLGIRPAGEFLVVFRFTKIESFSECLPGPSFLITFFTPPSFELQPTGNGGSLHTNQQPPRRRLSSLPGGPPDIFRYVSLAMRVVCSSQADLNLFKKMSDAVHLPIVRGETPSSEHRQLFSWARLERLQTLLMPLEWTLAFQIRAMHSNLLLDPQEVIDLMPAIQRMNVHGNSERTCEVLRLFGLRLWGLNRMDPDELGQNALSECLAKADRDITVRYMSLREEQVRQGMMGSRHVTFTPTRMVLAGPLADQSNRVLRQYPHNHDSFLRVHFTDEERLHFRWNGEVDEPTFIRGRVGKVLKSGFAIGNRKYEFLAYSQSALREHSVWFVAPFRDTATGQVVTAAGIRRSLGTFTALERFPAKYAARLSQAFSTTEASISFRPDQVTVLPDLTSSTGSIFTDGIGQISKTLADEIAESLERRSGTKKRFFVAPSAYQFRMGGAKGILMVDPKLRGPQVVLRQSQVKFQSLLLDMEVAKPIFEPRLMYLNRYMIMILETLGVPSSAFLAIQNQAVQVAQHAAKTLVGSSGFLDGSDCGKSFRLSWIFMNLRRIGLELESADIQSDYVLQSPFITRAIEFAVAHVLRDIKHKARIPVPGSFTLAGVADFDGYLEPDEIFVCIHEKDCQPRYLEGRVLVSRSPQVHPGDVQYLHCIGPPPADSPFIHAEYPNCIVFSTRGTRSTPSKLGGGDLDGDEYNVICNESLFPPECYYPAFYTPPKLKELDRPCDINDVADWVVDYINSDLLGVVSDKLLLLADRSPQMCRDRDCLQLADLHSQAVDFAKSGTPVQWSQIPKNRYPPNEKPDWWVGEFGGRNGIVTYASRRALGTLFRAIEIDKTQRDVIEESRSQSVRSNHAAERREVTESLNGMDNLSIDSMFDNPVSQALRRDLGSLMSFATMEVPTPVILEVQDLFKICTTEIRHLAASCSVHHQPLTEEEVLTGTILAKTTQPRKRADSTERLRTNTLQLESWIRRELAGDQAGNSVGEDGNESRLKWLTKAWTAWCLSLLRKEEVGARIFGMIALGSIFDCSKAIRESVSR